MALDSWLIKFKKSISNTIGANPTKHTNKNHKNKLGIMAFEISCLMSKLLQLTQSLSDKNITHLRNESISLQGIRKIVSNDDSFLLNLACAELTQNLHIVSKSLSRISKQCHDTNLQSFERLFDEFSNTGHDPNNWTLTWKDMDSKITKKMNRLVTVTAALRREMDELSLLETGYKNFYVKQQNKMVDNQQKMAWQRQQVKYLKERSLWSRNFDTVTLLLAKSVFTILTRIQLVFGITTRQQLYPPPNSLPCSLSASATVYPSEHPPNYLITSGPLLKNRDMIKKTVTTTPFDLNSKSLKPPTGTLGAAALSLHYSNLIIVMEKMIRAPQLVGFDARDDLYSMLPESIRQLLRRRLKGVGFSASDPVLAGEWREALGNILGWLSPLAHNMIRWQSERSFEQQNVEVVPKTNVLLLQTLYFANQQKTEAAITELLVGLNYICRFEREMKAKALLESANFNTTFNKLINSS